MKFRIYRLSVIVFLAAVFFLSSCSNITGYSVLLWGIPEHRLQDGDIVPVYIKSNISQVYVIGLPGGGKKAEVALWKITEPQSKRKASKTAEKYAEFKHQYAHVKLDGLSIRNEPVNTAKQVYRLRKNETVKLLYKGKGQAVMVGNSPLEGDWLRVLTQDGTSGWCFSYNLQQYETDAFGNITGGQIQEIQEEDTVLKDMLSKRWYPDYYTAMIRSQNIDIEKMNSSYGFDTGAGSGTVTLNMPGISESWQYNGVTKTPEDVYQYNDIPIEITVRNENFIVVRYTDESGKPQDFNMVTVEENIDELVSAEIKRRSDEIERLCANGGRFRSSNYGHLTFNEGGSFTWRGYNLLVPSLIVRNAGNEGIVSVKYFISNPLKVSYDGILTFKFDRMNKELNFLYKLEENGIRLTDAGGAVFKGLSVQNPGASPLVLFFAGQ
ncbi:SH3 domain-containing protein [Treponema parvum]|uniref:SH3 domain-containing protein n=1 Tax=Treponema parvum TaxID=138851 RepID=UPI001AEBAFB7|nr:SH3 domain-containing protein [Treponema parvum]QTQ15295.1 SH3 domain-containing protein [Treponema parvum]